MGQDRLGPSYFFISLVLALNSLLWYLHSTYLPQGIYGARLLFFVSARTNKEHHHLWRYHTRSVQCFAAAALASCNLAHPACFRKALRSLFVHTECSVVSPFHTSNVIQSVRASHLLSSLEISRPFSTRVSAHSLIGSPRWTSPLSEK